MNVEQLVAAADPVAPIEAERWAESEGAQRILASIVATDVPTPVRRSRSRPRGRSLLVAVGLVLVLAGAAAAGAVLFGGPAPEDVKKDLAGVDAGMPADLRYNPDVEHAVSVASTGASTLYYATLRDGGHCTEIVTGGRPRGAVCTTADAMAKEPIEVTVPFDEPATESSAVTVAGRLNAPNAATLEIRYGDGTTDPVALGDDRFFIVDVPASHLASVHAQKFALIARDADGAVVAHTRVPAVKEEDVEAMDRRQPIFVSTISDGDDFTKVLGVEGSVNAAGAVSLELQYPDGETVDIPVGDDGSYRYDIPKAREGDLFDQPGTLIARDAHGHVVATEPVAAVAYWRTEG